MSTAEPTPIFDDLLDLYANSVDRERLLSYRLPPEHQARLDALLQKNRDGSLTPDERGELEEFERFEHLGRMIKARLRQKLGI
jgi:hypothetical protein